MYRMLSLMTRPIGQLNGILMFALLVALLAAPSIASAGYSLEGTSLWFNDIEEGSSSDSLPLFGTGQTIGDQLLFTPTAFSSTSENGQADTTQATMTMNLVAKGPYAIDRITIYEVGDYALSGSDLTNTGVTVNGTLLITPTIGGLPFPNIDPLDIVWTVLSSDADSENGLFTAFAEIDFTTIPGEPIKAAAFSLTNKLQSWSEIGSSATITKQAISGPVVQVSIETSPVPLPGAVWLLGGGLAGLAGARIRKRKPAMMMANCSPSVQ